ncbi:hypothetical protein ASPCADRAFT_208590, partial [Aspergillus carbonarius ITEM 5010]
MDPSLPDSQAITAPIPPISITVEERFKSIDIETITHVVVHLPDKRLNQIMLCAANIPYDFDKPWAYWFFIGKILSRGFFGNED